MNRTLLLIFLLASYGMYTAFVYTKGTDVPAIATFDELALQGKRVWQKHHCVACHQLYGLGGYLGTDLTHVISQKGDIYTATIIKYGTQRMPRLELSTEEIDALIAFLSVVDLMPTTSRKEAEFTWFGMPSKP